MIAISCDLSSTDPRPHKNPLSSTWPAYGGNVQSSSVSESIGTTSWCASRRIGFRFGFSPFQVYRRPCSLIVSSRSSSWTRGKALSSKVEKCQNFSHDLSSPTGPASSSTSVLTRTASPNILAKWSTYLGDRISSRMESRACVVSVGYIAST
ncbi:hypothetical protein ABW21_db0200084 [Orbilia brochopaga]|nr:hypothetical protein ABW21_db0200084 [Drechslerella brochopaga]